MAQMLFDLLSSLGSCLNCFPSSPTLKINSRSFKILRLLGEGGFSYVYLVQDTSTSELFALKKIRCPFGAESVAQAMREVDAYKLFARSPGVIHSIDYAIATERGGGEESKTVYVLLPYYRRGNLQDMINANLVNHDRFPEKRLMLLFAGRGEGADEDDETEQQRPLMTEDERMPTVGAGKMRSYAHRDIKPANIMISDSGTDPIIMDLGSIAVSPLPITSRSLAIATQDTAAEHSTMPYRAPELFDVKTGAVIDTKVDIWSLGCTLYACLVGKSPFEMRSDETGGSLSICVVRRCLRVEPSERPDIDELIEMVERVVEELPEDGSA
ncbi:Serine/threonine-protein kinase env7 [Collariella sp. IMI 366227]|nr:Serine/threonine-protein kinase env7 [Collariella sp. IMI 366227]